MVNAHKRGAGACSVTTHGHDEARLERSVAFAVKRYEPLTPLFRNNTSSRTVSGRIQAVAV